MGHLTGEAYGFKFYPGKPCVFACAKGCSIYEMRPYDPCRGFECSYKKEFGMPEQFRPDLSNVIFVTRHLEQENIQYLHGLNTKKEPVPDLITWAQQWAHEHGRYIMVPRDAYSRVPPYRISVYGPDDRLRRLFAANGDNEVVD